MVSFPSLKYLETVIRRCCKRVVENTAGKLRALTFSASSRRWPCCQRNLVASIC